MCSIFYFVSVAATKSPVIFIGTGEHMDQFEVFDVKPFVNRLLGMGDLSGLVDKLQEVVPKDQQAEIMEKISKGNFSMRMMYDQYQSFLSSGPLNQLYSMLPGVIAQMMPEGESEAKIKRYMTVMDSMTNEELDSSNPSKAFNESRIMRIARGSGRIVREVMEVLEEYRKMAKKFSNLKGFKMPKNGDMSSNKSAQKLMSKVMSPQMLQRFGGMSGLQSLMRQMGANI